MSEPGGNIPADEHGDIKRVRRGELSDSDRYAAIQKLLCHMDFTKPPYAPEPYSGLVEQQRIFMKAARRVRASEGLTIASHVSNIGADALPSTTSLARSITMKRTASAVWRGDLKTGKGAVSSQSGVLKDTQYSFSTRFENGAGTNPEELIAAAHAGCYSMALSAFLGGAGFTPDEIATTADLSLEQVDGNWTITAIHLNTSAKIPGIDAQKFAEIANDAKEKCPISRVLNTQITLDAKLG